MEREKGRWREISSFVLYQRSDGRSEFVGLRVKVRLLNEGYAPRGRDSSSFGYFHPKGCLAVFSALRGHLAGFLACDKVALFDRTYCPDFGTGFRLGNGGNLDSCLS